MEPPGRPARRRPSIYAFRIVRQASARSVQAVESECCIPSLSWPLKGPATHKIHSLRSIECPIFSFGRGKRSWTPGGLPSVGCTSSEVTLRFYRHSYRGATYFSLPGRCSFLEYTEKSDARCRNASVESEASRLGGECATAKEVGSNGRCTWHAEPLGEVRRLPALACVECGREAVKLPNPI